MISPTIILVVVRYVVVLAMGALVHRGIIEAVPGDTVLDALAQIATGVVVTIGLTTWAALRTTKAAVIRRVAEMKDVHEIRASSQIAETIVSEKIKAP